MTIRGMQSWFNIIKHTLIDPIKRVKEKNHMTILIDTEESFDKTQFLS